jgi:hypothetical protein
MNLYRTIVLIIAFAAWSVSGQPRAAASYLPKNALACETGGRKCKSCNKGATIGALERVTVQAGGCGATSLTTVAEFTPDGATFFKPIATNSIVPGSGNEMTLGTGLQSVIVPGALLSTGSIYTNTIFPATDGASVSIPGSGQDSLQIGSGGACRALYENKKGIMYA